MAFVVNPEDYGDARSRKESHYQQAGHSFTRAHFIHQGVLSSIIRFDLVRLPNWVETKDTERVGSAYLCRVPGVWSQLGGYHLVNRATSGDEKVSIKEAATFPSISARAAKHRFLHNLRRSRIRHACRPRLQSQIRASCILYLPESVAGNSSTNLICSEFCNSDLSLQNSRISTSVASIPGRNRTHATTISLDAHWDAPPAPRRPWDVCKETPQLRAGKYFRRRE